MSPFELLALNEILEEALEGEADDSSEVLAGDVYDPTEEFR